ncbi:glycosyltransferase family 4 protein [Rhodoblastus acidophilus]|nr:glycosyltransferase family 4 protein [Rhodoblastus acidophilus]
MVSGALVEGWAWDDDQPEAPVSIIVLANGAVVGRCLANRFRRDLLDAGIGDGRRAFSLPFRKRLPGGERYTVEVRREEDGALLPGSPKVIETPLSFDQAVADELARILAAAETDEDFERRMAFLLDRAEKLKSDYSRKRSGLAEREKRQRWQSQDPAGSPNGHPAPETRPSALVIDDRLPDLARDAGSKAIVSHMQSLQRLGFDVSFAPADMRGDAGALEALGVTCHLKPWVNSVEEALERQRGAYRLVYLHRFSNASCYLALVRKFQPRARVIYSLADLHGLRLAREAAAEQRDDLARHSEWLQQQELWFAAQADAILTHSPVEREILQRRLPPRKIFVAPWHVAPNPAGARFAQRNGVGFLAHFAHRPNLDAAQSLVKSIMPEVWRRDPSIPCFLAGSEMPESLHRLASERVRILGAVADLGEIFNSVRLTVAPLAYGAGLKGKVLDSLAAGAPCVYTPVAAEGFAFPRILADQIRATPAEIAEAVVALHNDEALNGQVREAGIDFVRTSFSESQVDAALGEAAGLPGKSREAARAEAPDMARSDTNGA